MKHRLLILSLLATQFLHLNAQTDDFGASLGIGVEKKVDKKLSVGLEAEFRDRNNLQTNDRWSLGLDVDYKVAKWLKTSAGYTLLYDNQERTSYYDATDDAVLDGDAEAGDPKKQACYWAPRHRFNLSLTASRKLLGDFKFSLRERWQYTYRPEHTVGQRWSFLNQAYDGKPKTYGGRGKNVLRSRLQVEYDRKHLPLKPYLSAELWNAWSVQKARYTAGCDWNINKHHTLKAFYWYQNVNNDDDDLEPSRHTIGLAYKLKF